MSSTGSSSRDWVPLEIGGSSVELEIRVSSRASRISLRIDPAGSGVVLVLPSPHDRERGLRFAAQKRRWILSRMRETRDRIPFADGMTLPLLGASYRVRHAPGSADPVSILDNEIRVGGPAAGLPRQLAAWLRTEAQRQTAARSRGLAGRIGARVAGVSVRDQKSRWGSCSSAGALSYSWRLILAPEPVLDYVVAHEVAHLRVPDHSPRFWQLVAELRPGYAAERHWLKRHGPELHRYG